MKCSLYPDSAVLPPLAPDFFASFDSNLPGSAMANKLREKAGVRGPIQNAAILESPSSGLSATFSPDGEKGLRFTRKIMSKILLR